MQSSEEAIVIYCRVKSLKKVDGGSCPHISQPPDRRDVIIQARRENIGKRVEMSVSASRPTIQSLLAGCYDNFTPILL